MVPIICHCPAPGAYDSLMQSEDVFPLCKLLHEGDIVGFRGYAIRNKSGMLCLRAVQVDLLTPCWVDIPNKLDDMVLSLMVHCKMGICLSHDWIGYEISSSVRGLVSESQHYKVHCDQVQGDFLAAFLLGQPRLHGSGGKSRLLAKLVSAWVNHYLFVDSHPVVASWRCVGTSFLHQ